MTADRTTQPLDLTAIRACADAATDGPWTATDKYPHIVLQGGYDEDYMVSTNLARNPRADGEFIAAARTDVPALLAEVERLRELVGDENQPGWAGCSRAEAIRQAEAKTAALLEWVEAHDARRDERDAARAEVERMRPIVLAAISWRESYGNTSPEHAAACDALVAAVDEMGEVAW